ncbi:putative blastopia polyprotein [Trichonephila clavipes]|nr:putative blastopia polyprotein [Trichonephila clavipes]
MTGIYVINNSQTTIDVIIGTDVLKQTEFQISANGIELIPKKKDHFINLINVSKAHNQSELKDNALEVLQLKLKNAEDKCKNLEMHVCNTSTLSLEKTALLNKLHKLEESNLEKVDKLEEKYEILQETLKITEKRLVEKEIQCKSLTEKILIVNALTESNDNPKTSMSTKERKIKPSKRKIKKLKSSGRNANKTSDSDENQALAKEKNDLLRQIDFLNCIILDTKLKEPNKSKAQFFQKRRQPHKYKKHESVTIRRTQSGTQLKLRPKFCEPYLIKTVKPHDRNEVKNVGQHEGPHLTSTAVDFTKRWSTADA